MKKILLAAIAVSMLACSKKSSDSPPAPASGGTTPISVPSSVKDLDGKIYKTTTIGTQTWMAENLRTTKYNDGTAITIVTSGATWGSNYTNIASVPMMSYYNNNTTIGVTYGALYNWYAVDTKRLCPTGWHVPSDAEWTILTDYLGGESGAGLKLKSTTGWNLVDTSGLNGTNEVNFTALPGGFRNYSDGVFNALGESGGWWSATADEISDAWSRNVRGSTSDVNRVTRASPKRGLGRSVRCLMDY